MRRKDPIEAVERSLVERRVVLECGHHALGDGRLGRAVRAVQQDEPVRAPFAHEVRESAVELFLYVFLPDQRTAGQRSLFDGLTTRGRAVGLVRRWGWFPRQVEQAIARELTPGMAHRRLAVVIEYVAQVAACVARVAHRLFVEERQKLG